MSQQNTNRRNLVLGVVLLVQCALIALLWWPNADASAETSPLLGELSAGQITGIRLEDGAGTVTMARGAEGWTLADAEGYPVNSLSATQLIDRILGMDTRRPVATSVESHRRLQVASDEHVQKIEVTSDDGATRTIFIGSSPSARATHVRLDGSDTVYLQSGISVSDLRTDPAAWVDTSFLRVEADDVEALTLENGSGSFTLTRNEAGEWTLPDLAPGETVDQTKATTLVARATMLNMSRPLGKEIKAEYGLDAPLATVRVSLQPTATITDASGTVVNSYEIAVGARSEDGTHALRSTLNEYVVAVTAITLTPFISETVASLVVAPVITDTGEITSTMDITATTVPPMIGPLPAAP